MADDLMGLLQDALTTQGPTYAQNRFTQAPMILGNQPGIDPGSGSTQLTGQHGDLGNLFNQVLTAVKMRSTAPLSSQVIRISPTPNDPADTQDTIRHETIHSHLDRSGMTADDLSNVLKNSAAGQRLATSFNSSYRGDPSLELPAYIRSGDKYLPGSSAKDRSAYADDVASYLETVKKNPKAASTYRKLLNN